MQGVLQKRAFSSAVKTAVVYFVLSVFWVVATDRLVAMYVKNPQLNLNLQTIKGWLFVVVTTIFLFVILWRERKYYEDSIETEEKFSKVFQSSPYIIIMTRAEDGKIVEINDAFTRLSGYSRKEALENTSVGLKLWKDIKDRMAALTEIKNGKTIINREYLFRKKNNEILTGSFSAQIIQVKGVLYMLAIVEDISKRKEAEEKLAKVNADILNEKYKLEAILQDMGDAVFVTDEDKKIVLVNRAMENLFGLSEKEMYGKKIEETLALSYETTGEKPVDLIKSVFEKKRQAKPVSSLVIKHKSGQSVLVDGVASPILDAGGVLKGTVWVLRDVSKEKELEKMRIDFISLASHQLRTPLTGIKWFVELLQEDASKIPMDKVQEYIKRIGESSSRMVDLVNDLLTTSRADSGKLVKDVGNYSVKDLFQQAVEAQDRVFTDKKIRVEGVSEISSDLEIDADVVQMEQVLGNLLNNAACYSPPGSKIEIKVEQIGEKIRITVKDHGIGIPVSQQSKVFEKFFRANNVAGTIPGTGLGLYVAKSMVESHGGKIWFESKENEGTTFFVELPIKQKNEKKKVMIVEDDTVLANALKLALENEGYELSLATDGEEAERMIQLEIPDLILLDLLLPIKNGFEVLKVMRQNPSTKDISVVILTNFEQETSINEGKKLGAKDYIVKANIDIQDVPEIVKKYLPA